jgi:hypothetical protein
MFYPMDKNTLPIISLFRPFVNYLGYVRATGLYVNPDLSAVFRKKSTARSTGDAFHQTE